MSGAVQFASPQALADEALRRANSGDVAGAEPLFARLAELAPEQPSVWAGLGRCRLELGRPEAALLALRRAVELAPQDAAAAVNLAGVLARLARPADALAVLDEAASRHPEQATIGLNRGRALEALGRRDEARNAYDTALALDPRLIPALSARAALLAAEGEIAGAILDLDQALAQRPTDRRLRVRRAELALTAGDWLAGLAEREARLERPADAHEWRPNAELWRGEDLGGRRVVLFAEPRDDGAAMAEILQLARFVPGIAARAAEVMLETPPALLAWLRAHAALPDSVRLLARGEDSGGAIAVPLTSLLHLCEADSTRLPPSLWPAAARSASRPRRIGMAPLASGEAHLRATRDLPLGALEPLSAIADIEWISLQPPAAEASWLQSLGLPSNCDALRMSATLDTLDMVVAADNWIAHLAAVKGLPVALLLDRAPDWRWLTDRSLTPWYPTMRLYRQIARGDWRSPIDLLLRELRR